MKSAVGEVVEHKIDINSDVDALCISSSFNVIVDDTMPQGEVRVVTHTDMLEFLDIDTEGTTLNIELTTWALRAEVLDVYIPAYEYGAVAISGGANLTWRGCNVPSLAVAVSGGADIDICSTSKEVAIAVSGGADIEMTAHSEKIAISASGGTDINISGSCKTLDIAASGGTDIDIANLIAEDVSVTALGGADIEVYASNSLKVEASGGADVTYAGNPPLRDIKKSGGADIEPAN